MSFLVIQKRAGGWSGSIVEEHRAFMRKAKDQLIAFGPLTSDGGGAAGYVYFTSHDATPDMSAFVLEDPLSGSAETICHAWRSRLGRSQVDIPPRPGMRPTRRIFGSLTPTILLHADRSWRRTSSCGVDRQWLSRSKIEVPSIPISTTSRSTRTDCTDSLRFTDGAGANPHELSTGCNIHFATAGTGGA
jgi:hypothetical protein